MHKVRLYPKPAQRARLEYMLHQTRHLWNAALEQRRDAWKYRGVSVSAKIQYAELTELRAADPGFASVYQECSAAVIRRLDIAMAAFFRRLKRGEAPGYPRFKPASRWRQLEFPHGNRALKLDSDQRSVRIPGVGRVALRKGRAIPAFGRAFVVERNGHWHAIFECERDVAALPATGRSVGVDRGVVALVALSDVGPLEAPRIGAGLAAKLTTAQRRVSRRKKRSMRRRAAVRVLARVHERIANARRDYAHKLSRALVDRYDTIALEELRVVKMTRSAKGSVAEPGRNVRQKAGLNRSILDAAWSMLKSLIVEKAACAARTILEVEARYTSQECNQCGCVDAANRRSQAVFCCVRCGHASNADWNAARVIAKRAKLSPAGSCAALAAGEDLRSGLTPRGTRFTQHDAA